METVKLLMAKRKGRNSLEVTTLQHQRRSLELMDLGVVRTRRRRKDHRDLTQAKPINLYPLAPLLR